MRSAREINGATELNRRQFLKKLGTGAAAGWAVGVLGVPCARSAQPPDVSLPGSFGRMFRLPPSGSKP